MRTLKAVRRILGKGIIVAGLVGLVVVGLVAQVGAYLFGFTAPAPGAAKSAYSGLSYAAGGEHPVGVRRIGPDDAPMDMTLWYPAAGPVTRSPR